MKNIAKGIMLIVLGVSVAGVTPAEITDREFKWASAMFGLAGPLKIEQFASSDGGAVGMTVVDPSGRELSFCILAIGDEEYPGRLVVGGLHPDYIGVRSVPLWGEEERALVFLAARAIDDTLSTEDKLRVQEIATYKQLPDSVGLSMWRVVKRFGYREGSIRAREHGELESLEHALRYCQLELPLNVVGQVRRKPQGYNCITVTDANNKMVTVCLRFMSKRYERFQICYSPNSGEPCHPMDGWGFSTRAVLTIASHAINELVSSDTRDKVARLEDPNELPNDVDEALWKFVQAVEKSKRLIDERDASRDS